MSINRFAEAGESNLIRMMKVGCLSLMSNYLIFATGVANLIMMTKDCAIWLRSRGLLSSQDQQYRTWLRAKQFNLSKKMVVEAQGYSQSKSQSKQRELRSRRIDFPEQHTSVEAATVVEGNAK